MSSMNDQMTFDEYVANLPRIDWYYNMSDDPGAYRRGAEQVKRYEKMAEENGPEWQAAFDEQWEKHRIR